MQVRRISSLLLAAALAIAVGVALPASGARPKKRLGAAVAPLRLVPRGKEPISIGGLHSYFGSIELASAGDGLVVSNRLPLERYLLGLNEVPLDWPMEALRAQAVAARTYALFTLGEGRTGEGAVYGFDICASVQCQVFSGADVIATKEGARWIEAVESTEGIAVLYDGAPILARYHSTSGGQTLDNEDAFPDESAYPYLQGVPSTTEQGSPVYRWHVTFKLRELEAILRRAGHWTGPGRVESVVTVPSSAGLHYPDVVIGGKGGRLRMTAEELRDIVRDLAPAMFPGRFPSRAPTTSGVLPETFPSNRLEISTSGKKVLVVGRGWGHGSGMSQWGAHGLATRGASYADILAHYYTGTSVGTVDTGGPIEVGVSWGASTVTASGSFRIVDGRGKVLVPRGLGTWTFSHGGAGAVTVDPPKGYGLPLEVGIVKAPKRVVVGEATYLTVALSRPAKVTTITARSPTGYRDPGVAIKEAGRRRVVWLAPLEEGRYTVKVRARAGPTAKHSESVQIDVREPDVTGLADDVAEPRRALPVLPWLVAAGAAAALVAVFSLVRRSNRKQTS